jgi:hypothetical protein
MKILRQVETLTGRNGTSTTDQRSQAGSKSREQNSMYGPVSLNCTPRDVDGLATAAMMDVEVVGESRNVDEEEADVDGAPTTPTAAVYPDSTARYTRCEYNQMRMCE